MAAMAPSRSVHHPSGVAFDHTGRPRASECCSCGDSLPPSFKVKHGETG